MTQKEFDLFAALRCFTLFELRRRQQLLWVSTNAKRKKSSTRHNNKANDYENNQNNYMQRNINKVTAMHKQAQHSEHSTPAKGQGDSPEGESRSGREEVPLSQGVAGKARRKESLTGA